MHGVIIKRIGSRVYEIQVAGECYRRHVDQILRNHTPAGGKNEDDYLEYDFVDGNIERPSFSTGMRIRKKYPKRARKSANRYGWE